MVSTLAQKITAAKCKVIYNSDSKVDYTQPDVQCILSLIYEQKGIQISGKGVHIYKGVGGSLC